MGMSILFVLFTVVLVSTHSDSINQQDPQADTFINTRIKRESENDCIKREHRVIMAPLSTSKKPVSSAQMHLKPNLVIRPNNASPNRIILPIRHIKAKALTNTTPEASNKLITVNDDDISRKVKDTELDEILKPLEKYITLDEPIIDNDTNGIENDFIEKSEIKGQQVKEAPKIIKGEEEKGNVASVDKGTRNDMKNKIVNRTVDSVEKDFTLNLDSKQMLPTDTLDDSILLIGNLLQKSDNASKLLCNDTHENVKDRINNDEAPINLANGVSNHSNTSVIGAKIGIVPIPLPFLTSAATTSISTAKHFILPKVKHIRLVQEIPAKTEIKKTSEDFADTIFRKIGNDDNKIIADKNIEEPILPKSIKNEPEDEILIQNNNYEELFESSPSSQYLPLKVNAIELCPALNWNNFHPAPLTPLEKFDEPKNADVNNNKPYLYDVKTYPNHYVVDAYNEYNNNNFNQMNQGYNNVSPLTSHNVNVGQRSDSNYSRGSNYPRDRIWRSWQNNQIVIKPKLANSVNNEELYKNINEYVANARRTAVNNGAAKIIRTTGEVNQNVSPRSYNDPFQLRKRYGY